MAEEAGAGERKVEAPPLETEGIVWREDAGRFETPDGEAFLQYRLLPGGDGGGAPPPHPAAAVMDMVHTYVPRSKRGQGLAARLCDAAFAHARSRGMRVVPTCSYISVRDPPLLLLLLCYSTHWFISCVTLALLLPLGFSEEDR